ncbi:hypothetical protein B7486_01205 [cyanobacterium TDX16]|nr:hypothetical protein B7486_01205 [cyanobacterium TDX16]
MTRLRRALAVGSLFFFGLLATGCAESNIRVCNEPTFSKLAGRWSASACEVFRDWKSRPCKGSDPFWVDDRLVLLTITPDGRVDWSRSYLGIIYGLRDLNEPHDRCAGFKEDAGPFELVSAEYTPTRTHVEVSGLSLFKGKQGVRVTGTVTVELDTDGVATLRVSPGFQYLYELADDLEIKVRRHDRQRRTIDNASRIAGTWVDPEHEDRGLLIIREDGTFDWSGTLLAWYGAMHQLEFPGDRTIDLFFGCSSRSKLISAKYEPDLSAIFVRSHSPLPFVHERFSIVVHRIDDDQVSLTFRRTGLGVEEFERTLILRRSSGVTKRWSTLHM